MAPKGAKRSAPPPPPAPSSEDTTSGSGSDEAEDEEETAHSTPPAAPKQKGQEPEASDEDDEEEEEELEEEEERANHVTPHSATKNPPTPKHEESETSDEEDEEADSEMPRPKPAPKQEAEEKRKEAKPSSSIQDKKRSGPFQSTWSTDDEVRILEALAAHRLVHGTLPQTEALAAALAGSLDKSDCSHLELEKKVKSLRSRYSMAAKKGELPSRDHGRQLFYLSKSVWGSRAAANGVPLRGVSKMYRLYPYLAEEVRALEKAHPGLFKREFEMVNDDKARALDEKIKKQRRAQMKVYQRRYDLIKEVTKTLVDLDSQGK